MILSFFENLLDKDKSETVEKLIAHSSPRREFFLMITFSMMMATFGLLMNNIPALIGSMLVSPTLYPALSISMGLTMRDLKLTFRSIMTLVKASLLGVLVSLLITVFYVTYFGTYNILEVEPVISKVTAAHLMIAVVAGLAASFSLVKSRLNDSLPGTAIAVSLIPPLAGTGIGIAEKKWELVLGTLSMFGINILGIVVSGTIVFILMNFYLKRNVAASALKEEDQENR